MVNILLKSTLREIRQSLGRYLAIFAIIGLGVGFLSGLRMSHPSMIITGANYLERHSFYDFQLMSSLGFTDDDVDAFRKLEGVDVARGSVYTEFLWQREADDEVVLISHMLTPDINEPNLIAGRLPAKGNECLGDSYFFTENDLGKSLTVSPNNDEDTLDLLAYDEYTIVGIANSPLYLNYDRGTASIGSGSISAFLLMPEESFESDAYYEIYLRTKHREAAYSDEYQSEIDRLKPQIEDSLDVRAVIRYETLYHDALDEIQDGEKELKDAWDEYRTERADAEQELADAYQELLDGEQEYTDGLADYEQGKIDYADGLKEYQDALIEIADGEQELADGWIEYHDAKLGVEQELADAYQKLLDGEQEYADGLKEYEDGLKELQDAEDKWNDGNKKLDEGRDQLSDAKQELSSAKKQLDNAEKELEQGESSYQQLDGLYQNGQTLVAGFAQQGLPVSSVDEILNLSKNNPIIAGQLNGALQAQGSSLSEFEQGWTTAEQQLGAPLNDQTLSGLRTELDSGWSEYNVGKNQYDTGYNAYRDGLNDYRDGLDDLAEARKELDNAIAELEDARVQLEDARKELDDGWAEYEDGKAEAEQELADAYQELLDAEQKLADGKAELIDAEKELSDAKEDLDKAPQELADAREELDDGWVEYRDGLAEAQQEFSDAEQELFDGEQEIADAYEELADLKSADTFVLTRKENLGYVSFDNDTSIIAAVSVIFPIFFFLVAALVCMTTMKRMVDEQRTQIGVLKAMGYSRSQIIGKYLFYSGSAAVSGSIIGYALGSWGIPLIIWEIYAIMYGFAPLEFPFDPILCLICFCAALLCSMGATYLSCRVELMRPAAELIRPKTPKAGKRIFLEYFTPIWKRMNFLHKVSARNILRYKSRLIMMILGIGGCTALLLTGFGLRDSLSSVVDEQFDQITVYDYEVSFQEPQSQTQADRFLTDLGWSPETGILVHHGSTDAVSSTVTKSVFLVVPANNQLDGFVSLHEGERQIPFPHAGEAVVNIGLAIDLGIKPGDTIKLRNKDIGTIQVTVSDICDNFISNYVFVAPETYQQQLGIVPEYKSLFVLGHPNADPYEEGVLLSNGEGISRVTVNEATRQRTNSMLSRLDIIIIVVVFFAAALAFIVLYNLTNINITERIREIATIKVLGFYRKEVASYVFREINVLSLLGSLVGLLMGKVLHAFVMAQVQVDALFFPTYITPFSYLISVALTMLFTVVITNSMRPRLNKINMAESLKSIE